MSGQCDRGFEGFDLHGDRAVQPAGGLQGLLLEYKYLAQLMLWPSTLRRREAWALHRLWSLPPQTLPKHDILAVGACCCGGKKNKTNKTKTGSRVSIVCAPRGAFP